MAARSLQTRIPLSLAASSLLTAFVLVILFGHQEYAISAQALQATGRQIGHAMAVPLTTAIKHDDVWSAYTHLKGPDQDIDNNYTMIVADRDGRILASNRPRDMRTGMRLNTISADHQKMAAMIAGISGVDDIIHHFDDLGMTFILIPMSMDGDLIGALAIGYSDMAIISGFLNIAGKTMFTIIFVLPILLAVGLYWGRRLVKPLADLENDMSHIETGRLHEIVPTLPADSDEISQLTRRFHMMVEQLKHQESLEQQMAKSERLAALGRLAAGVAHEINNPLGGMLLAIDTWRTHDPSPARGAATLELIERGLQQVQQTVSALLVEARPSKRPFSSRDLDDVRTLLTHPALKHNVAVEYHDGIPGQLNLPAPLLRQLLINLNLNAIQACPRTEGAVKCSVDVNDGMLHIDISNNGPAIPEDARAHIFEPFWSSREDGTGLGLWLCWQIVSGLQGDISFNTDEHLTTFHVHIPLPDHDDE